MRGDLVTLPVEGRVAGTAAVLGRPSILGEVEVDVDHPGPTNGAGQNLIARMDDRGQTVAVPHQELDAAPLDDLDQSVSGNSAGR
jgi:hypothetical protein